MAKGKSQIGDQVTVKVHNFVKDLAEDIKYTLKKHDFKITEIAIYDIMAKRLEDEFKNTKWSDEKSVQKFVESLLNDLEDLQSKDVKVKYRAIGE